MTEDIRQDIEAAIRQELTKPKTMELLRHRLDANGLDAVVSSIVELVKEGKQPHIIAQSLARPGVRPLDCPDETLELARSATQICGAYHALQLEQPMRGVVEAELAKGNTITESSRGWPKEASIVIKFAKPVTTAAPLGTELRQINDPHYWKAEIYEERNGHLVVW